MFTLFDLLTKAAKRINEFVKTSTKHSSATSTARGTDLSPKLLRRKTYQP